MSTIACTHVTVTETNCTIHSHDFPLVHRQAWEALYAWVEFHGINPMDVPMVSTLVRNIETRCVEYDRYERDADNKLVQTPDGWDVVKVRTRAQGETPPLPWPAELLELA